MYKRFVFLLSLPILSCLIGFTSTQWANQANDKSIEPFPIVAPTINTISFGGIRGFVINKDGTPAIGVKVSIKPEKTKPVSTDGEGMYEFTDIPTGILYTISADGGSNTVSSRAIRHGFAVVRKRIKLK